MKIVLSGVNLIDGGPLKVFRDAISSFAQSKDIELTCLVHDIELFKDLNQEVINFLQYPDVKSSWLRRLWFEYFHCFSLSKRLGADVWISMHDMSPRVVCRQQYVYCHNPAPFFNARCNDFFDDYKFFLFTKFYKYLYRINIKSNVAVIVQQNWLAKFFYDKFNVNTIVSSPVHTLAGVHEDDGLHEFDRQIISNPIVLFYPALARTFKNFELVLAAFEYLSKYSPGVYKRLKLILTIGDGNGRYERKLVSKYAHLTNVSFVGILTREDVDRCYQLCDVVIFPSRLETWGLPISEAKSFNKPLLLADLPYARETLGVYDRVKLINVDDYKELAIVLGKLFLEESVFSKYDDRSEKVGKSINSWDELRDYIMKS